MALCSRDDGEIMFTSGKPVKKMKHYLNQSFQIILVVCFFHFSIIISAFFSPHTKQESSQPDAQTTRAFLLFNRKEQKGAATVLVTRV